MTRQLSTGMDMPAGNGELAGSRRAVAKPQPDRRQADAQVHEQYGTRCNDRQAA